jgi:hypothetical protein
MNMSALLDDFLPKAGTTWDEYIAALRDEYRALRKMEQWRNERQKTMTDMQFNVCKTCGASNGRCGNTIDDECRNCYTTRMKGEVSIFADLQRTAEEIHKTIAILIKPSTPITPDALLAAGWHHQFFSWHNYWRSLDPQLAYDQKYYDIWTIEVRYDGNNHKHGYRGREYMVYVTTPSNSLAVWNCVTMEDLAELYRLFVLPTIGE